MPETANTTPPADDAAVDLPQPPVQDGGQPKDDSLGEPGIRALQAERDARRKAQQELADLRQEIDDAKKTAEQRASEALAEAQRNAADARLAALRYEVAAEKGIALQLANRLSGTSREELLEDADALKALIPDGPKRPAPDPSQGQGTPPAPGSLQDAIAAHYTM